ncbi:MAG: glycosyltransferase family 9 protein [Bdellovibrionia bacterium]
MSNSISRRASRAGLRILVIRPDRLGDVVLSTPVFEVIKRHYPDSHLTLVVRESVAPVVRGLPSIDEVLIFDPEKRHAGFRGFLRLVEDFRKGNYRIAVVLQGNMKIAAATFFSNIRYRVGPLSKIYSYFLFNRGIRQHRSQVEMHETDYNLQLLRRLGIRVSSRRVPLRVSVPDEKRAQARAWLLGKGWNPEQPLVAVHPGMGGSALNWPETHYVEFVRTLLKEGRQVLLTGGPAEVSLLNRIGDALGPLKEKAIFYSNTEPVGGLGATLEFFAGLISHVSLMVAPSTGPLHLAVALDRPVLTFYPPIRVQSAIRWGPYLKDESRASVMVPDVYCGQDFKCLGNLCNYFPCMKSLTVTQALDQANQQLAKRSLEIADQVAKEMAPEKVPEKV